VPPFRILLVDDFEPFRRFVRLALQSRTEFEVAGEASDGLEAVHKAKELQPDLILLDIGLPKLSGLAAAEQIRILAPDANLLFVSMETSSAIVQEAFRLGAVGYISKLRAQDLVVAIDVVLAGKQFVSSDLEVSVGTRDHHRHDVQVYSDDMFFVEDATRFIGGALKAGGAAIVIATSSHRESILQSLKADGFDMDGAIQQGTYISLNAADALLKYMMDGRPDRCRVLETLGGVIDSAARATKTEHPRVVLFGEGAALLWAEGKTEAAIQVESICNGLFDTHDVDIVCPYPLSAFQPVPDRAAFKSICAEHTAVFSR
jgi:DNA-binding NarL/FixJ family response regulator